MGETSVEKWLAVVGILVLKEPSYKKKMVLTTNQANLISLLGPLLRYLLKTRLLRELLPIVQLSLRMARRRHFLLRKARPSLFSKMGILHVTIHQNLFWRHQTTAVSRK